jgi:transcriptional regulator with XRE-family HTH domain
VSAFNQLWKKLAKSKRYREEFVAAQVKRGIPFQIRSLLKKKKLSQEELAKRAGVTQGVVSRAADPEYGNLTLNTIIRIAAGFDVAFIGKFVPFSELGKWFTDLSEDAVDVKSFEQEDREQQEPASRQDELALTAAALAGVAPRSQASLLEGGPIARLGLAADIQAAWLGSILDAHTAGVESVRWYQEHPSLLGSPLGSTGENTKAPTEIVTQARQAHSLGATLTAPDRGGARGLKIEPIEIKRKRAA